MPNVNAIQVMNAALQIREAQISLTASNLINQDTPEFKAKGINFKEALTRKLNNTSAGLKVSDPRHFSGSLGENGSMDVQYVQSETIRGDGNTVNSHLEKAKFAELQVQYQAALTLSQTKTSSLTKILTDNK